MTVSTRANCRRVHPHKTCRCSVCNTTRRRLAAPPTEGLVLHALTRLNNLYGRGDILNVDHQSHLVWFQCTDCVPETAAFSVVGHTVRFRGHQMTVTGGEA